MALESGVGKAWIWVTHCFLDCWRLWTGVLGLQKLSFLDLSIQTKFPMPALCDTMTSLLFFEDQLSRAEAIKIEAVVEVAVGVPGLERVIETVVEVVSETVV